MDGGSIRNHVAALPNGDAARLAAALIEAGHRRLALIVTGVPDVSDAFRHLCAEAEAAHLPPAQLIDTGADLDRVFFGVFRGTRYPTGLVCADAATAEAVRAGLRWLGFRVPDDVAVRWPGDEAQDSLSVRMSQDATTSVTAASRPL